MFILNKKQAEPAPMFRDIFGFHLFTQTNWSEIPTSQKSRLPDSDSLLINF